MRALLLALAIALASATAAAAEKFVSPELETLLLNYRSRVALEAEADTRPPIELFRLASEAAARGEFLSAVDALEVLAGRNGGRGEGGSRTWLRLGIAQQRTITAGLPPGEALVAAYAAYKESTTPEDTKEALYLLAYILFEITPSTNPAESSTEDSSANTSEDEPPVNIQLAKQVIDALAELQEPNPFASRFDSLAKPFQLTSITFPPPAGYAKISQESACEQYGSFSDRLEASKLDKVQLPIDPGIDILPAEQITCEDDNDNSICLIFNQPILADADLFSKFTLVTESGLNFRFFPILSGEKACFAGIKPGGIYTIRVNPGLQSSLFDTFARPLQAIVKIPDQAPSLGFQSTAYVLPTRGARTVPIKAVNVKGAAISIRRLGNLNLLRDVILRASAGDLSHEEACLIRDQLSEKIADGKVGISFRPNETAQVNLPFGSLLEKRTRWLEANVGIQEPLQFMESGFTFRLFGNPAAGVLSVAHPDRPGVGRPTHPAQTPGVYAVFGEALGAFDMNEMEEDDGEPSPDRCRRGVALQWLVSTNIGLTVQRTPSFIYAIARNLDTGAAVPGARIEFVSRSGQVIANGVTDSDGMVEIRAQLGRGQGGNSLVVVMAYGKDDFTYVGMADSIDLPDRGFDGRLLNAELDAFIAPARGIYRPGEVIEALVLIRSPNGEAVSDIPPIDVVWTRNGVARSLGPIQSISDGTLSPHGGAFRIAVPIPKTALEGPLGIEVRLGTIVIGSIEVEVRFFEPNTIELDASQGNWNASLTPQGALSVNGQAVAKYLYSLTTDRGTVDAPATNLHGEFTVRLEPVDGRQADLSSCLEGYTLGHGEFEAVQLRGVALRTSDQGRFDVILSEQDIPSAPTPLQASVTMQLFDSGGLAVEQTHRVPVRQIGKLWIAARTVRPANRFEDGPSVELMILDDELNPVSQAIELQVYQEPAEVVWASDGASWQFETQKLARIPVGEPQILPAQRLGPANTTACPPTATVPLKLPRTGTYVVVLSAGGKARTELTFVHGWTNLQDGSISPDALAIYSVQGPRLGSNDKQQLQFYSPHSSGRVFGQVFSRGKVLQTFDAEVNNGIGQYELDISAIPRGGFHVYATSFKNVAQDDPGAGPVRAIGGTFLRKNTSSGSASLEIAGVDFFNPYTHAILERGRGLSVNVLTSGLQEKARAAIAVVDEGVLALTDFATPDPEKHYFGAERLAIDVFDSYGRVVFEKYGSAEPAIAALRGGDFQPANIVSFFSGIVEVNDEGVAGFRVPQESIPRIFSGKLRIMAWAWDEQNALSRSAAIIVRDPAVISVGSPNFMAPGDSAMVPLVVRGIDLSPGEPFLGSLEVRTTGGVKFDRRDGAGTGLEPCALQPELEDCGLVEIRLANQQEARFMLPVIATEQSVQGSITVAYSVSGEKTGKLDEGRLSWLFPIRGPSPKVPQLIPDSLVGPGKTLAFDSDLFQRLSAVTKLAMESISISARVSPSGLLAVPDPSVIRVSAAGTLVRILSELQMLLSDHAGGSMPLIPTSEARRSAIQRATGLLQDLVGLQAQDGAFLEEAKYVSSYDYDAEQAPSPSLSDTAWALDVLAQAQQAGLPVSGDSLELAASYLRGSIAYRAMNPEELDVNKRPAEEYCSFSDLYALIVLSRVNSVDALTMHRVANFCSRFVASQDSARLLLAAAYNSFGFVKLAEEASASVRVEAILPDPSVASVPPSESLRALVLALETKVALPDTKLILDGLGDALNLAEIDARGSSWLARLSNALHLTSSENALSPLREALQCSGVAIRPFRGGADIGPVSYHRAIEGGVQCTNNSENDYQFSLIAEGIPIDMLASAEKGLSVNVVVDGVVEQDTPIVVQQFEPVEFVVTVTATDGGSVGSDITALQLLPSGFEVAKPVAAGPLDPKYSEASADRWMGLIEPTVHQNRATGLYVFRFVVRPVLSGEFVLPPIVTREIANSFRAAWSAPRRIVVQEPR